MARIRTLKPDFFQHPKINSVSFAARLLAIGLTQMADRSGRLLYSRKGIEAHTFPDDDVDISGLLGELVGVGYLVVYEVDGRSYLWVRGFTKHQRVPSSERASELPECPDSFAVQRVVNVSSECRQDVATVSKKVSIGTGNVERGTGKRKNNVHHRLWTLYCSEQLEVCSTKRTGSLTSKIASSMKQRLRTFSESDVEAVIRWAHRSTHQRAQFLRSSGNTGKTLFLASNFEDYLGFALSEAEGLSPSGSAAVAPSTTDHNPVTGRTSYDFPDPAMTWRVDKDDRGRWSPDNIQLLKYKPWRSAMEGVISAGLANIENGFDAYSHGQYIEALSSLKPYPAFPDSKALRWAIDKVYGEMREVFA